MTPYPHLLSGDYRECGCETCEALRDLVKDELIEARLEAGIWRFRPTIAGMMAEDPISTAKN